MLTCKVKDPVFPGSKVHGVITYGFGDGWNTNDTETSRLRSKSALARISSGPNNRQKRQCNTRKATSYMQRSIDFRIFRSVCTVH